MTQEPAWQDPFEILRRKWHEVPVGEERRSTVELLGLPNAELLDLWLHYRQQATTGPLYHSRGWYHDLYKRAFRGWRLADVGSGLGYEGVTFAQEGATVTFVDVAESNLEVIRRLCQMLQLTERTSFVHLKDLDSWCNGSLHHAPFDIVQAEARELLRHLRPGGRWIQLAYPRYRWEREGSPPFSEWGGLTDGEATPWAEWYDLDKVLALLEPEEFNIVAAFEFHNRDFIWFDLRNVPSATHGGSKASPSYSTVVSSQAREENERLRAQVAQQEEVNERLRAQVAQQGEVTVATRKEMELHRERLVLLCRSRWRKFGMRLGLATRPYWEHEYRTPP
jgi:SAM-dependent methyltransferase